MVVIGVMSRISNLRVGGVQICLGTVAMSLGSSYIMTWDCGATQNTWYEIEWACDYGVTCFRNHGIVVPGDMGLDIQVNLRSEVTDMEPQVSCD